MSGSVVVWVIFISLFLGRKPGLEIMWVNARISLLLLLHYEVSLSCHEFQSICVWCASKKLFWLMPEWYVAAAANKKYVHAWYMHQTNIEPIFFAQNRTHARIPYLGHISKTVDKWISFDYHRNNRVAMVVCMRWMHAISNRTHANRTTCLQSQHGAAVVCTRIVASLDWNLGHAPLQCFCSCAHLTFCLHNIHCHDFVSWNFHGIKLKPCNCTLLLLLLAQLLSNLAKVNKTPCDGYVWLNDNLSMIWLVIAWSMFG